MLRIWQVNEGLAGLCYLNFALSRNRFYILDLKVA